MNTRSSQTLTLRFGRLSFCAAGGQLCFWMVVGGLGLAQTTVPAGTASTRPLIAPTPTSKIPGQSQGQARIPMAPAVHGEGPRAGPGRFMVLLDAAHGGDDNGAQLADGTAERTITLALSVRLRSLLGARGFQVMTTREGNVNVLSDTRAQIANRANAAACISLHASESGSGVHIFTSSLQPREPARFMAWKTAQGAFVTRSLKLASVVNSAFEHSSVAGGTDAQGLTSGSGTGPIPATLGRTALPGIDSMECPAVAVELAPIRDADRRVVTEVTSADYQTQVVEALAAAILEWRTDWDTEREPDARPDLKLSGSRLP